MDFGDSQPHASATMAGETVRPVCHCLNVTESEIREVIAEHEPQSVRGVSQLCGAGSGCMSCHRHIRRMLNERILHRRTQSSLEEVAAPADHGCTPQFSCG